MNERFDKFVNGKAFRIGSWALIALGLFNEFYIWLR